MARVPDLKSVTGLGQKLHSCGMHVFYYSLANRGPVLPGKNLVSFSHPSGHFLQSKVFSPVICLGFGVWGRVGGFIFVLRTSPELVGRSGQNFGRYWSAGLLVKEGLRYKQSLL